MGLLTFEPVRCKTAEVALPPVSEAFTECPSPVGPGAALSRGGDEGDVEVLGSLGAGFWGAKPWPNTSVRRASGAGPKAVMGPGRRQGHFQAREPPP